jgi:hypothetical protein
MKPITPLLFCLVLFGFGAVIVADEGMWLFNAFPSATVKARYGFEPTEAWLDHVRLSSVRFPDGSGSFVSPNGLTFTNHHIAAECIHDLSTAATDYMKRGFYARTQGDERRCPRHRNQRPRGDRGRDCPNQRCRSARDRPGPGGPGPARGDVGRREGVFGDCRRAM